MQPEENQYPSDWLKIAEKDWSRVKFLLDGDDAEAAGLYLQQAVEKFPKAFLLSHSWQLERIHDLESLLNESTKHNRSFEEFRKPLQKIAGFYFINRYPPLLEIGITREDVETSLNEI